MDPSIAREELDPLHEKDRFRANSTPGPSPCIPCSHFLTDSGEAAVPAAQGLDFTERMAAWANPDASFDEREQATLRRAVHASLALDRLRLAEDQAVRQRTVAALAASQLERAALFQKALDLFHQDNVAGVAALWPLADGCRFLASRWVAAATLIKSEHDGADLPAFILEGLRNQLPAGESAEVHFVITAAGPWHPATRERLFQLCEQMTEDLLDLAACREQEEEIEATRHAVMVAETPDADAKRRHQRMKELERVQRQAFCDLSIAGERRARESERRAARARTSDADTIRTALGLLAKKSPFHQAAQDLAEASEPPPAAEGPSAASSGSTEQTLFAIPSPHDLTFSVGWDEMGRAVIDQRDTSTEVFGGPGMMVRARAMKQGRRPTEREWARRTVRPP